MNVWEKTKKQDKNGSDPWPTNIVYCLLLKINGLLTVKRTAVLLALILYYSPLFADLSGHVCSCLFSEVKMKLSQGGAITMA